MAHKNDNIKLVLFAVLLNTADVFFTSLALDRGVAELNPIMASVLSHGMTWFLFNKLIVVNLLILFLGIMGRNYRIGRAGMVFAASIYTLLIVYHMVNLTRLTMV